MKFCTCLAVLAAASSLLACGSGNAKFIQQPPPPPTTNQWTWIGGSNLANPTGNYGLQGVASASNVPPPRGQSYTWVDSSGTFWLFGGSQVPTQSSDIYLSDLWKYSGGQWTWVGGPSTPNQPGVWGTQGVADPANVPSPRQGGASWIDKSGNFWLFGGLGLNAIGMGELLNDLWEYSNGQWTWVSGSNMGAGAGVYGTIGVPSVTNIPGSRQIEANWQDSNGNFWLFGGLGYDSAGTQDYLNDLWEYTGGQWVWISGSNVVDQPGSYGTQGTASPSNVPGSRLESAGWADSSGNFWLFGGATGPDGQFHAFNDLWKFSSNQWTWVGGPNTTDQDGNYGTQGIASSSNIPSSRVSPMIWLDRSGNLWLFGGDGHDSMGGLGVLNDLWKFDGTNWTWIGGANVAGQPGTYGTMGTPAASNTPGARLGGAAWIDSSGNLWLFGGNGLDSAGKLGYLNDLWEYQP